jgi:hypothetical protein
MKKSLKQKETREFVDGRVADNLSLRKKKREQRLGDTRGFSPSTTSTGLVGETAKEFIQLCAGNLKEACRQSFESLGQTNNPTMVMWGLMHLKYLVETASCQPRFPDVYKILPAQPLMDRLCVLLKTTTPDLQSHVQEASECVTYMIQAQKQGDLEFQWSNAVTHANLIQVVSKHILENPSWEIRRQMLYAAIHFARRSRQNAIDAALSPVLRNLLAQKKPETYEFVIWYISDMCQINAPLDWTEFIGDLLWSFARGVLKESNDPVMVNDALIALCGCMGRKDIFERTCKDVGMTRLFELFHRVDSISIKQLCHIFAHWLARYDDTVSLSVLQRGHTKFLDILKDDSYGASSKIHVLHICQIITCVDESGVPFMITQGYLEQVVRYLERRESLRHMNELIDISLETLNNMIDICAQKRAPSEIFHCVYSAKLVQTIGTHVHIHYPNRQRFALSTLGGLLHWAKRFNMQNNIRGTMEEEGLWEKIYTIYTETPEDDLQKLTEWLLEMKGSDMD